MSNRQKIEQQTNILNEEWSKLRIQSIPLSASSGALANKKVCAWCYRQSGPRISTAVPQSVPMHLHGGRGL